MSQRKLRKELREVDTNSHEIAELLHVAKAIGNIKVRGLPDDVRDEIARIPGKRTRYVHVPARYAFVGAFAVVVMLVGVAQSTQPGSPLYKVKRGTESVRAFVQPSYVETMTEERKTEVEQLKHEQAAPEKIEKAERDYQQTKQRYEQRQQTTKDRRIKDSRTIQDGRGTGRTTSDFTRPESDRRHTRQHHDDNPTEHSWDR